MKKLQRLPTESLVLICDARKALFLRNAGTEVHPKLEVLESLQSATSAAPADLKGTPPGRRPDMRHTDGSHGPLSAMKEPDFNRLEEEQFTNTIIARIPILGATMGMQSLIVVAPARMLGGFRNQLPKDLQNNLLAEIPKLLTHLTVDEMTSQLVAEW